MGTKEGRPQNKNLIPLTERPPEEARAIRSAGGKASQQKAKEKRQLAELLSIYADLPIGDKRIINRLKKMGIKDDDLLTQKMLITDAIMKAAKNGNMYAVAQYIEITGEGAGSGKSNNLLEAILNSTEGDLNTDDIPEIQSTATAGNDMVESTEV